MSLGVYILGGMIHSLGHSVSRGYMSLGYVSGRLCAVTLRVWWEAWQSFRQGALMFLTIIKGQCDYLAIRTCDMDTL